MRKRLLLLSLVALFGLFLASCKEETPVVELTVITVNGADDITLDFEEEFNIFTGVTAIGNDGVDYTEEITYVSQATISATGVLDTTQVGVVRVRYEVRVGEILKQHDRYVTVNAPEAVEGEMLVNPDFAQGTAGWDDPSVVYNGDGSTMTLSTEDGALKAEVVAGANPWTPRFGQMNVPFENGKTYEVSFEAKSSAVKIINLQVGEIILVSPWFTDFKPGLTIHKEISTEWATYSYKFNMTQDNQRGGVLFELGAIDGVGVNATVWFDNITIVESTPDADVDAPVFTGVQEEINITVGATYDPMAGVTAFDLTDGDVTDEIVVTYEDSEGLPLLALDTNVEGTYTVIYTIEDSLGNEGTAETIVNIVSLLFSETNLVANASFAAELNATTPEWAMWVQNWGAAPVVVATLDATAGTYAVDITGGGDAAWAVQMFQDGYIELEEGKTYKLSFTVASEAARSISVALGYGDPWVEYMRQNGVAITATEGTYEFIFTVTQPTHAVKLVFELGSQTGFADGTVTFSEVKINELDVEPIIENGNFDDNGWSSWSQNWGAAPTVTIGVADDAFQMTTDLGGDAGWAIQFNQAGIALEEGKTYTISFDAKATVARDINVAIFIPVANTSYFRHDGIMLTTEMATYSEEFTVSLADHAALLLSFEMGATAAFAAGTVTLDNISIKENVALAEIVKNGDATSVLGFSYDNAGSGVGTMKSVDGEAVVEVTTLGGAAYTPHFYQMISGLAAGNYTLKLVITSTVARDFRLNLVLPNADYVSLLLGTKYDFTVEADVEEVVYVNFTIDNPVTNVKLELDFGTLDGTLISLPGTFTISEVLLYQNFN